MGIIIGSVAVVPNLWHQDRFHGRHGLGVVGDGYRVIQVITFLEFLSRRWSSGCDMRDSEWL